MAISIVIYTFFVLGSLYKKLLYRRIINLEKRLRHWMNYGIIGILIFSRRKPREIIKIFIDFWPY